jgi:hypothetical protein
MKRKETHSNARTRVWLEPPAPQPPAEASAVIRKRASVSPGFLAHHWSVTAVNDLKKNWTALEIIRRSKAGILQRFCRESLNKDASVLNQLASDNMYAFAEFFYAIHALGLAGVDDIMVLLDLHNSRVAELAKKQMMTPQRLAAALFPETDLLHIEEIWRETPGGFEQSTLARFLAPYMAEDSVYMLVIACEAAGFLIRTATVRNAVVVSSTGLIEEMMTECLREMRFAIRAL